MSARSTSRPLQLLAAALLTTVAVLVTNAGPAAAQPAEPAPPPVIVHSSGPVPESGLLSPGSTVAWPLRVDVGVAWKAELALSMRASGQLAESDPGVVVSVRACSTPWNARSCTGTVRTIASDIAGSDLLDAVGVPIGNVEVEPESYLLVEITAIDTQTLPQAATGAFVLGIVARELFAPDPGTTPPGPPAPEVTVPLQPGAAAASPSPAPALAFTGASLLVLLLLAAIGVGVGVLLIRAGERRRSAVRATAVVAVASLSVAVLALGHLSTSTDASWTDEVHAGGTISVGGDPP